MYLVLEDLTADPARCGGSLVRTINFHNTIWAQAAEVERVDGAVREGDYRLVFSNTKIQRIPST